MSLHPCFRRRWLLAGLPRESFPIGFVDISSFLWLLTKILPRRSPRAIFKWKNLIEPLKAIVPMNIIEWEGGESWMLNMHQWCAMKGAKMGQHCSLISCAKKDSLSGTVMMAWIWHVWINAIVFGCLFPWHKLLRRLTQKNCCIPVYSQSKFDRWVYILVFAEGDCCRFA